MESFDFVIIGGGVVGASVAFHLSALGSKSVLLLEQDTVGSGTTAQSSGLIRTHYSVSPNIELARDSWRAFANFSEYVQDDEASSGLVQCGYMICAPQGAKNEALRETLRAQQQLGVEINCLSSKEAHGLLPIAEFKDSELVGFEPHAGFADAYLVTTGFARTARRSGVKILEHVRVTELMREGSTVRGVRTTAGDFCSGTVISAQSIWSGQLSGWVNLNLPVKSERHVVLALESASPYGNNMPALKDLGSEGMPYYRSYGGTQMLVSEGITGEVLNEPNTEQSEVTYEYVMHVAEQVARRFPKFEDAALASSWTGVYDVTPDWNPVLGPIDDVRGLLVAFGFSGHGFKLAPSVGRLLAQHALGLKTDMSLEPYALSRFHRGAKLTGRYGAGAVS